MQTIFEVDCEVEVDDNIKTLKEESPRSVVEIEPNVSSIYNGHDDTIIILEWPDGRKQCLYRGDNEYEKYMCELLVYD